MRLKANDEVCQWLVNETCQDRSYGARPLRRAIQRHIEDALSEELIMGELTAKGTIEIYVSDGKLAFRTPIETPSS